MVNPIAAPGYGCLLGFSHATHHGRVLDVVRVVEELSIEEDEACRRERASAESAVLANRDQVRPDPEALVPEPVGSAGLQSHCARG